MSIEEAIKQVEHGYSITKDAHQLINDAIFTSFLFTWRWWLGVALLTLPWIIWVLFRKKDSTHRLLYAGLSAIVLALLIDNVNLSFNLWSYPVKIVPYAPMFILPYHISLLPVAVMFTIQWKPNLNPFIKGVILAAVGSFVTEPVFVYFKFYNPKNWPYYYDFFMMLSIYLVAHYLSSRTQFEPTGHRSNP